MISVVIPCFNSEEFVERAIESVLRQTCQPLEIILVDNGSADNTWNILCSYKDAYPGLIKVLSEKKKGGSAARNRGLMEAKGEWIQFLDADDELLPRKLEEQMFVANNCKPDLIISGFYKYFFADGVHRRIKQFLETKNIWRGLINSALGRTSGNLWRREAVLKVNGWDESKTSSQEYHLLFNMLKQNSVVCFCHMPLTNIYIQNNSVHKHADVKRSVEIANNYVHLRLEIKKFLKEHCLLTPELNTAVNISIYEYLMPRKQRMPEYVEGKIKELGLSLPISFLMKWYIKKTRNYLKTAWCIL